MNILPKKRWHVRTKDNIARVRKDEANAREEEEKRKKQLELAESEARLNFLRKQSDVAVVTKTVEPNNTSEQLQHVDLFADFQTHIKTTNKELEKEKKEEQEKYEKQIGYLTYLGQDTNEALKLRSWYEVAPKRSQHYDNEILEKDLKVKIAHDPLSLIKALLPAEKQQKKDKPASINFVCPIIATDVSAEKQHKQKKRKKDKRKHDKISKKHKKHSSKKKKRKSNSDSETEKKEKKNMLLEQLRQERLRREALERARQEALLNPKIAKNDVAIEKTAATPRIKQKYNSQFNPEIAKQNM